MLARVLSAALRGVEAALVRVEVDVSAGLPAFHTVGLPDSAVRESRERVRSAIRNAGFAFPSDRITVNLAPADLRKEGASSICPSRSAFLRRPPRSMSTSSTRFAVVGRARARRPDPAGPRRAGGRPCVPAPGRQNTARACATTTREADGREEPPRTSRRHLARCRGADQGHRAGADGSGCRRAISRSTATSSTSPTCGDRPHAKRALEVAAAGAAQRAAGRPTGRGQDDAGAATAGGPAAARPTRRSSRSRRSGRSPACSPRAADS